MSEFSTGRCHRPLTPRRLNLLVPRGWDSDSEVEPESETGEYAPPHDIMEAFLVDIECEKPAPPPRFAPPMSDKEVQEAKKAAVPKTTQRDISWCISLWKEWRDDRNSRSEEQIPSDICARHPRYFNAGSPASCWRSGRRVGQSIFQTPSITSFVAL